MNVETKINKEYRLEVEVLSPLSIGAGQEQDWARGVDFIIDNGKLYKLNLNKIIHKGVTIDELTGYFLNRDDNGLKTKLHCDLKDVSDKVFLLPAESLNDIKTIIKNKLTGNPIIPGSSLKGAIMSVLYKYFDGDGRETVEVFGSMKNGTVFGRFLRITDAEFVQTQLVNTKIFNLCGENYCDGGWKHGNNSTTVIFSPLGFNTLYECLMPGEKSFVNIRFSDLLFNKVQHDFADRQKAFLMSGGVYKLFEVINAHTKLYLQKERRFFEEFSVDKTDRVVASINELLGMIPKDNSYCLLKMAAGSGFHSITGDWQFDDYTKQPFDRKRNKTGHVNPKSRKIAIWDNDKFSMMGFVKLRLLSDVEISKYEQEREHIRDEVARLYRESLLSKKIEEENRLKQERELSEKLKTYNTVIREVEELNEAQKYIEAWNKYLIIKNDFPDFQQSVVDVSLLESKAKLLMMELDSEIRAKEEAEKKRLADQAKVEGGLSNLLNVKYEFGPNEGKYKIVTFKVCEQTVTSWLKKAGLNINDILPLDQQNAFVETVKRLVQSPDKKETKDWADFNGKIWRKIETWLGYEEANKLFIQNEH